MLNNTSGEKISVTYPDGLWMIARERDGNRDGRFWIKSIDINYDSAYPHGYVTMMGEFRWAVYDDGPTHWPPSDLKSEYVWGLLTGTSAEVSYDGQPKKPLGLNRSEDEIAHGSDAQSIFMGDLGATEYIVYQTTVILEPVYFSDKQIGSWVSQGFMMGYLYKEDVYPTRSGATVLAGFYSDDCQCIKGAWYQSSPVAASVFIAIRKTYNKEDSVCFYLWSQQGVIRKNCVKDPTDNLGLAQKSCTLDLAKTITDDLAFNIDTEVENTLTVNL
jgi:hypothetical protein